MAGSPQALKVLVNTGDGCAKRPEQYPAKPNGGFSHGPPLKKKYT